MHEVVKLRAAESSWSDSGHKSRLNNAGTGPLSRRAVDAALAVLSSP